MDALNECAVCNRRFRNGDLVHDAVYVARDKSLHPQLVCSGCTTEIKLNPSFDKLMLERMALRSAPGRGRA